MANRSASSFIPQTFLLPTDELPFLRPSESLPGRRNARITVQAFMAALGLDEPAIPNYQELIDADPGYFFPVGMLVTSYVASVDSLLIFRSLVAGQLQEPSGEQGDANWERVAGDGQGGVTQADLAVLQEQIDTVESDLTDLENTVILDHEPRLDTLEGALVRSAAVVVNGVSTFYPTFAQAQAAAPDGATITLTGYHAQINIAKSLTIGGGVVGEIVNNFTGGAAAVRLLPSLTVLGRLVNCTFGSNLTNTLEIDGIGTGSGTWLEQFALTNAGPSQSVVTVRGVRLRNTAAHLAPVNGQPGSGAVRFQEKNGNSSQWTFEDCALESVSSDVFSGYQATSTRITLTGDTRLTPGPGRATQVVSVLNSNQPTADANFFVDQRTGFVPISQNQHGTHPAFATQRELNAYLLGGTPPAASGPTLSNLSITAS